MTYNSDISEYEAYITPNCTFSNIKDFPKENNKSFENHNNYKGEIIDLTPIQQFYNNQVIFITGGTGFLGKILIEKLLRSCPSLKRMYLLIRQKKGKEIQERIGNLLNDPVFDSIRPRLYNLEKKIVALVGDCSLSNLGLSDDDLNLLTKEVSIVFHVAATVRFDEKLKQAAAINIQSISSILNMCKSMDHLKSFIHVSSVYANCFTSEIEEKFYDYPVKYKELLHLVHSLPEEKLDAITPQVIEKWPNTYTFTKALAEDLIRAESQNLPVGIFRPGIVVSSAHEPIPGWTDNFNGPMGIAAGAASGVIRVLYADSTKVANLVPVDLTVNALIASAWDITTQTHRRGKDILIYNFSSTSEAPMSWQMYESYGGKSCQDYPSQIALWCFFLRVTKYKLLYNMYAFILHIIPGLLIDFAACITGQKPRLLKAYRKIHKMTNAFEHFAINEWDFKSDNVQNMWKRLNTRDQKLFQFSMQNFDWPEYFSNYIKGIRTYLLKDSWETLERSKMKHKRLAMIQQFIVLLFWSLICWAIGKIILLYISH